MYTSLVGGNGGPQWYLTDESGGMCDMNFNVDHSTTPGQWITTSREITINAYNAALVTYDDDSTSNNPSLYVNGSSKTVTEVVTPVGTYDSNSGNTQRLGNTANAASTFDGDIAYFSLWTSVLTSSQIQALANGVNPFVIDNDSLACMIPLWGNQTPEPDYKEQVNLGTVSGAIQGNPPQVELIENYL